MRERLQPGLAHRLTEEEQAPETLFKVPVEETGSGTERLGIGDQPEMRDPVRHKFAHRQIGQQRIIAFSPMLGRQGIGAFAGAGKRVACMNRDDTMPRRPEPLHSPARQTRVIGKDKPCERGAKIGFHVHKAVGRSRAPGKAIAEIGHAGMARGQHIGHFDRGLLAGFHEIARTLERIGGQRHPTAAGIPPDL